MKILGGLFVVPDKPRQVLQQVMQQPHWLNHQWNWIVWWGISPKADIMAAILVPDDVC